MGGIQGQQFMLEKEIEYKSMSPTMSNITYQFTGRPICSFLPNTNLVTFIYFIHMQINDEILTRKHRLLFLLYKL